MLWMAGTVSRMKQEGERFLFSYQNAFLRNSLVEACNLVACNLVAPAARLVTDDRGK
jgi:hypothetical protein